MTQNKIFQIDEFWADCTTDPNLTKIYQNKSKINKSSKSNIKSKNYKIKSIKSSFNDTKNLYIGSKQFTTDSNFNEMKMSKISLNQTSLYNRKNIREALIKEDLIPLVKKKRRERALRKCLEIYNKDKVSREMQLKKNENQKIKNEKLQIKQCTFKPQKCSNKKLEKKINRMYSGTNIYERNIKFKEKHNEKMAFLFNEISKVNNSYKNSQCFFQPILINSNVKKILYDDNNIWKEQANNDSNKLFLLRYIRARDEEFYKKEKLNNSVNKRLKTTFSNPRKMTRSISQKDSVVLQKNLHNILYSLGNILEDGDNFENENDDNNNEEEGKIDDNKIIDKKSSDNFQWTFAKKF